MVGLSGWSAFSGVFICFRYVTESRAIAEASAEDRRGRVRTDTQTRTQTHTNTDTDTETETQTQTHGKCRAGAERVVLVRLVVCLL